MKPQFFIIAGLISLSTAFGQSCRTVTGIDLGKDGPYAGLPPRDQGNLGTCYAHSASDLISSYLGISRINIYNTIVANDTSVDGGHPADVIDSFARVGFACTDLSLFYDLFPNKNRNIIGDLQDTFIGSPIYYTLIAAKEGFDRQDRIALIAKDLADQKFQPTGILKDETEGIANFHKYRKIIEDLNQKIEELNKQKHWYQDNKNINQQITGIENKINILHKKADLEHQRYANGMNKLNWAANHFDEYSEEDAAEAVFYLVQKQYLSFKQVMSQYNLTAFTPSLGDFIVDRVRRDPVLGNAYNGAMYPYKILKQYMYRKCPQSARTKIPFDIKGELMSKSEYGINALGNKIENLLSGSKPQAIGITIDSSLLTGQTGELHAVNIIGCRRINGKSEYLIQNSWGSSCTSLSPKLQEKCSGGRVWIPSDRVLGSTTEIQWVTKKKNN